MSIIADDDGIARIRLRQSDPAGDHVVLALDCTDDDGRTESHTIDVAVAHDAVPQRPEAVSKVGKPTLPRLDVDPMSLSKAEIRRRGYPPRPDPKGAPGQYAKWLELVASEPTMIKPRRGASVPREGNPENAASVWSGVVISTPPSASAFDEIFAQWSVPGVTAPGGGDQFMTSSLWVGLDGYSGNFVQGSSNDVVQTGTEQDTLTIFPGIESSSYYAWTEWFPLGSVSTSLPVQPGDEILGWTWVGGAAEDGVEPGDPGTAAGTGVPVAQNAYGDPFKVGGGLWGSKNGSLLGDFNGDGRADVFEFGSGKATGDIGIALGTVTGFEAPVLYPGDGVATIPAVGVGDVNGDGLADAIYFTSKETAVILSSGTGFGVPTEWGPAFYGPYGNTMGKVNRDNYADAVAFSSDYVWVMPSEGSSFGAPTPWTTGPFNGTHGSALGDVNGDGLADIVAFDSNATYVMLSNGTSAFGAQQTWTTTPFYGTYGTVLGDVNGDKLDDAVGFNANNTWVMLSNGSSFGPPIEWSNEAFYGSYTGATQVADMNGDGRADAVGFNATNTYAETAYTTAGELTPGTQGSIYGYFFLWNHTENQVTGALITQQPGGTSFVGHEAEWILEWPSGGFSAGINNSGLANYHEAALSNPWASDYNGVTYYANSATSTLINGYNGSDYISGAGLDCPSPQECTIGWDWQNYY